MAKPELTAIRGMKDVLPPEDVRWQRMLAAARRVLAAFGFSEVRLPVLERTELFARSIGEATDIVEKEMYTFSDRSGDSLTLRPEATAGVVRAFIEHKLHALPGPHKWFLIGPMFRHERPQKGRLRMFHQLDVEVLGDKSAHTDAELMIMLARILTDLGLKGVRLVVNSLGCPQCRPGFREALVKFLQGRRAELCEDCQRRLDSNPLRVLDCKVEGCRQAAEGAPNILEHICADCAGHFDEVRRLLGLAQVEHEIDPRLVRGLDYYVRTTFEAKAGDLGAQDAVAGGGRYDGLVPELGGQDVGASGFAVGLERLALILPEAEDAPGPDVFIAAMGQAPRSLAFMMVQKWRKEMGLWVEMTTEDKSLKAQMKRASKLGAKQVLILGPQELKTGELPYRDMNESEQKRYQVLYEGSPVFLTTVGFISPNSTEWGEAEKFVTAATSTLFPEKK